MVRAEASWKKIFAVAVPSILLNGKSATVSAFGMSYSPRKLLAHLQVMSAI